MTKLEARQAWIRGIIDARFDGKISGFARAIGKDPSYVSRMLYPEGKRGAKGIGEETVAAIIKAFPTDAPPPLADMPPPALGGASDPRPIFTKERRADDNVRALQIGLESLLEAVLVRVPGAAEAFLADVKEVAHGRGFSTEAGFLGSLVDIAHAVHVEEEAAAQVRQHARSAARTRREKQDPAP